MKREVRQQEPAGLDRRRERQQVIHGVVDVFQDFGSHRRLFPDFAGKKEASQPASCQWVLFVATNMLVLVYL